ncbi:hypothetical protein [Sneathiella limimaris]|uniref:hypothetical protein n=1 Tax=Sneathiella limimaris TaxID=1964213 RepID=UPI00146D6E14|nr:hypothetical protein [Sneathiella limimaris]
MLSPIKLILLALVIGAVFMAARMFRGKGKDGGILGKRDDDASLKRGGKSTDLIKCPDCGTYVSTLEDHTCKD